MSNAKRPTTVRKSTRATKAAAEKELDRGLAYTDKDGVRIEVRLRDVKAKHDAALVAAAGMDFVGLLDEMTRRQGLDLMCAMYWFGRLVTGRVDGISEGQRYQDVLEVYGWDDFLASDFDEPAKKSPAAPKA